MIHLPVPALGFVSTRGRVPLTGETRLKVQFRNGWMDDQHTYTAKQLRWADEDSEWDVVAVRRG